MLVAATVVVGHVDGSLVLDASADADRFEPDYVDPIACAQRCELKKWPRSGAIFIFICRLRRGSVLALTPTCGDWDFHCTRLSPMIFIEVIAAWLSDA